uniref:Serpentine receptor class gamma n=1 Tax=Meloidogyne floridensis TaxID=298350 RepID=A0A915P1L8_9BILA
MSRLLYASKYKISLLKVNEISSTMKLYLAVNVFCGIKFCETQTCMQHRLKNYPILFVKTCFGICNIICCIVFLKLLARVGGDIAKKLITGYSLSVYTGELSYLTLSLELAICGVFYWRKFKTRPGTQVTLLTSHKNLNNTAKQPWTVNVE